MDYEIDYMDFLDKKNLPDITEVGKYGKFIKVEKFKSDCGTIVEYINDGVMFKSSDFICEKFSEEHIKQSLSNMRRALFKHIYAEIDRELEVIKYKLIKKYEKKYNTFDMFDKIHEKKDKHEDK